MKHRIPFSIFIGLLSCITGFIFFTILYDIRASPFLGNRSFFEEEWKVEELFILGISIFLTILGFFIIRRNNIARLILVTGLSIGICFTLYLIQREFLRSNSIQWMITIAFTLICITPQILVILLLTHERVIQEFLDDNPIEKEDSNDDLLDY